MRIRERWQQQRPAVKAVYVTAAVGAVVALVAAVLEATLPLALGDEAEPPQAAPATTTPTAPPRSSERSPTPPALATPAGRPSPTQDSPPLDVPVYLSDQGGAISGDWKNGIWRIDGENYIQSVRKYCGSEPQQQAQVWSTAGFNRLTGVIGFADGEEDAIGVTAQISILDQDGRPLEAPFDVALGKPKQINVDLQGAVQTQIICTGRDTSSGEFRWDFHVILGDAALYR